MNILIKVTLGKVMFDIKPLCYHICFHLRIFFSGNHRNESKLCLVSKMDIFLMFCFLWFIVKQIIHKSYVLVHFVMPEYCCRCHVNKFFSGRASSVSFYFPKSLVPSKLQICKTFAQVCIFRVIGLLSPVNSPHKGQQREAFVFSLICA